MLEKNKILKLKLSSTWKSSFLTGEHPAAVHLPAADPRKGLQHGLPRDWPLLLHPHVQSGNSI